jgi:hypothetical protein
LDTTILIERAVALLEVGKKISADRRKKLMTMMQMLQAMMAEDDPAKMGEAYQAASLALEEALSYSEREELIRDAIKAKVGGGKTYCYLIDTYPDSVIYSVEQETAGSYDSRTYQASYALVDNVVTLGDPVEVKRVTSYVPVSESDSAPNSEAASVELEGECIPLVESVELVEFTPLLAVA